jgi:hypothetical protein
MARSKFAWVFGCFLPAVPFVHGGFELGETQPVNTGLDFSTGELALYPAGKLPLYAPWAYDWSRESRVLDAIRRSLDVRDEFLDLVTVQDPASFSLAHASPDDVVGYVRADAGDAVAVVGNASGQRAMARVERLPFPDGPAIDRLSGRLCEIRDGILQVELAPWECLVLTRRDGSPDRV